MKKTSALASILHVCPAAVSPLPFGASSLSGTSNQACCPGRADEGVGGLLSSPALPLDPHALSIRLPLPHREPLAQQLPPRAPQRPESWPWRQCGWGGCVVPGRHPLCTGSLWQHACYMGYDGAIFSVTCSKNSSCPGTSAPGFKAIFGELWRQEQESEKRRGVFPRAWPRPRALPRWTGTTATAQPGRGGGGRCSPGTRVWAVMALALVPSCLVLLEQFGHLHL